ncbi:hypothetical protein QYF36_020989 [Acer negundo]|nr:hypothetical protein QYF36_020989 [Acer negundo]
MLDEAAKVGTTMNDLKLSKEACCSWIEIDNKYDDDDDDRSNYSSPFGFGPCVSNQKSTSFHDQLPPIVKQESSLH